MKNVIIAFGAALLFAGSTGSVVAQETTVIHKESGNGDSKTVVKRETGSKTIIKTNRHHVKKVNIHANGDKTIITKTRD
jgi:hypothetical protein